MSPANTAAAPSASIDESLALFAGEDAEASLVHELKTPLASLLGYARLVRGNWDRLSQGRREECFEIVERQGRRLLSMMEALLDSRAMTAGAMRREPVHLQSIVTSVVETAEGLREGNRFDVRMPEGDLGMFGDAQAIEHVLTNLLDNAVKHSPPGSKIGVEVQQVGGRVILRVVNGGNGIPASELPFVFDRFRRATNGAPGHGLGLSIVKRLVAAHGGSIDISSTREASTTVTVSLPRRAAQVLQNAEQTGGSLDQVG